MYREDSKVMYMRVVFAWPLALAFSLELRHLCAWEVVIRW